MPALLGSVSGLVVYVLFTDFGFQPIWSFPAAGTIHAADFGWALGCGFLGAAVAIIFTFAVVVLRQAVRPVPLVLRPLLGGVAIGLLAFWSPYALTYGEAQVDPLLLRDAAASVFIVAVVAKLSATSLMLSSGWRGGFIIPLFFIGAALGRLVHVLVPGTNEVVLMSALMTACVVGVTKTTLGSTLVVTEMAGLQLLPTTLVAALAALFLTSNVSLIATQREREDKAEADLRRSFDSLPARPPAVGTRIIPEQDPHPG